MSYSKKFSLEEKQLSLWDMSTSCGLPTINFLNEEIEFRKQNEFQLSFPVSSQNFSLSAIDFVKIVLLDDQEIQDAILFITQSQEGIFHLIFFEKMKPERLNPRRLEIVLESSGNHYQRVSNTQHWETDYENQYDIEEWDAILRYAGKQILDPRNKFLVLSLLKLLTLKYGICKDTI